MLQDNSITDVGPLRGLTMLRWLYLSDNPNLTDIQPLIDNGGFGRVELQNTNVGCADVAALEAKGVIVESECP